MAKADLLVKEILNQCKNNIKQIYDINSYKIEIFNNLRNFIFILTKNSFEKFNKLLATLSERIMNNDFERISDFYLNLIRPFYNKVRDSLVLPFLLSQLNDTLIISIIMFVFVVLIDIVCLLVINFFIIRKVIKIKKNMVSYIDMIKK